MNQNVSLVTAQANCEEAVAQAVRLLSNAGLQAVRSFDLQSARASRAECACPHHGTAQCTCQFVVLLVYGHGSAPVAVVAHGYDGQAWFSLVDTPQQPADLQLAAKIARALAPQCSVPLSSWGALA